MLREQRARAAGALAELHDGVAHRRDLRAAGVTRDDVRTEVRAGRWVASGRHTVVVRGTEPTGRGALWHAVWESGSGAVLDGAAALVAAGMTGFTLEVIDVSVPRGRRVRSVPGVRVGERHLAPCVGAGLPRVRPEWATIHAAQWAKTDRQAALLVCLPVQQRLVAPQRLLQAWGEVRWSPRRALLDAVIRDVCDGAQSLGELDLAGLCRARGLPEPSRQVVRTVAGGRVYLDADWDAEALTVEVDGGHHALALHPLADALRQNEVTLGGRRVLRVPVLGLRLDPDAFLDQIGRGLRASRLAPGA